MKLGPIVFVILTISSVASADDIKARWAEYKKVIDVDGRGLLELDLVEGGKFVGSNLEAVPTLTKQMLQVKAILPACSKYGELKGPGYDDYTKPYEMPQRACALAARADELVAKFIDITSKDWIARGVAALETAVSSLEKEGSVDETSFNRLAFLAETRDSMVRSLAKLYDAVGVKMPADLAPNLDEIATRFAAVTSSKRVELPKSRFTDAALDKLARSHFTEGKLQKHSYKVSLVAIDADWSIIRGRLDQPVRRDRTGRVVVQVEGEKFCRLYQVTFSQENVGGSKYQAPGTIAVVAHPYLASCK